MKIVFLVSMLIGYSSLVFSEVDTQAFFDVKEKCDYHPLDLTSVSDNTVDSALAGIMGVVNQTPSNTISGYNVDGQVY